MNCSNQRQLDFLKVFLPELNPKKHMIIIFETLRTIDKYSRYLKQFGYSDFTSVLINIVIYRMFIMYWLLFLVVGFYF